MKIRNVYFDNTNQKIRWTQSELKDIAVTYEYIGKSTRLEFDLLIELLWHKYEDSNIDIIELKKIFNELRSFCDSVKQNYSLF